MNSLSARQHIEAIKKTLEEAKSSSGLGPEDPSVIALEKILLTRIAELEEPGSSEEKESGT